MNKKFPYGYDVDKYIDKALDIMKETYSWATRELFNKQYSYNIEKVNDEYEYVEYYRWNDGTVDRKVQAKDAKEFIQQIINDNSYWIEEYNKVKETYKVPSQEGKMVSGWYLERYEIRSHELGGYSAFVQAGDRTTGGSRTFFIPPKYFEEETYDKFLDKYLELVPGYFGMGKSDLINNKELKKFLGYKK